MAAGLAGTTRSRSAARREAIRGVVGDEPLALDDEAWSRAQESHTGAAVIPVSVVGPLLVELGAYELEEPEGTLRETGRAQEEILVPLAHTEGGLSASMSRGMKAAQTAGGFRTYVLCTTELPVHRALFARTPKMPSLLQNGWKARSTTCAPSSPRSTTRPSRSGRSCAR